MTIFRLTTQGFIQVSGPEAAQFLQGQVTCDVLSLAPDASTLGCCCTPQGRVQAIFRLFRHGPDYFLRLPKNILASALAHFRKYAIFSKVELKEVSAHWVAWGSDHALPGFSGYEVPGGRFEYYLPRDIVLSETPAEEAVWHFQNLQAGIPEVFPETQGHFTPHELNLPTVGAVSFTKGCYTGQEIIARMHYRGKLKWQVVLRSLPAEGEVRPGASLANASGEECGQVLDAVFLHQAWQILALLREETKDAPIFLFATKRE